MCEVLNSENPSKLADRSGTSFHWKSEGCQPRNCVARSTPAPIIITCWPIEGAAVAIDNEGSPGSSASRNILKSGFCDAPTAGNRTLVPTVAANSRPSESRNDPPLT
jgi:hypothetical protein